MALLEHDKFALIKRLLKNRWRIVYCVRWARAKTDAERAELADEMKGNALLAPIHDALTRTGAAASSSTTAASASSSSKAVPAIVRAAADAAKLSSSAATAAVKGKAILDLEALAFAQGGHFMSNPNCTLPEGTYTVDKKGYQEVHVPALKTADMGAHERLVDIASLPEWAHAAFTGMKTLNRVQSRLYQVRPMWSDGQTRSPNRLPPKNTCGICFESRFPVALPRSSPFLGSSINAICLPCFPESQTCHTTVSALIVFTFCLNTHSFLIYIL